MENSKPITTKYFIICKFDGGSMYPMRLLEKSKYHKDFDTYKWKCDSCGIEISATIPEAKISKTVY